MDSGWRQGLPELQEGFREGSSASGASEHPENYFRLKFHAGIALSVLPSMGRPRKAAVTPILVPHLDPESAVSPAWIAALQTVDSRRPSKVMSTQLQSWLDDVILPILLQELPSE